MKISSHCKECQADICIDTHKARLWQYEVCSESCREKSFMVKNAGSVPERFKWSLKKDFKKYMGKENVI